MELPLRVALPHTISEPTVTDNHFGDSAGSPHIEVDRSKDQPWEQWQSEESKWQNWSPQQFTDLNSKEKQQAKKWCDSKDIP